MCEINKIAITITIAKTMFFKLPPPTVSLYIQGWASWESGLDSLSQHFYLPIASQYLLTGMPHPTSSATLTPMVTTDITDTKGSITFAPLLLCYWLLFIAHGHWEHRLQVMLLTSLHHYLLNFPVISLAGCPYIIFWPLSYVLFLFCAAHSS